MSIKDGMVELSNSTKKALDGIRVASGKHTDRDIIRYESFAPEDFEQMREDFGEEQLFEYIRQMETRRLLPVK